MHGAPPSPLSAGARSPHQRSRVQRSLEARTRTAGFACHAGAPRSASSAELASACARIEPATLEARDPRDSLAPGQSRIPRVHDATWNAAVALRVRGVRSDLEPTNGRQLAAAMRYPNRSGGCSTLDSRSRGLVA